MTKKIMNAEKIMESTSSNNTLTPKRKSLLGGIFSGVAKGWRVIWPTQSDKALRNAKKLASQVDALDSLYSKMSDDELRAKTQEFKTELANGASLDQILPEAFATVREVAWRVRREKPYIVQLIGGIILHSGMISEMKTGEGKTLVATMPAYLNALEGKGVHIITVNDYLAKRDAKHMGDIFRFLGLTVGCVVHGMSDEQKQAAYACDITYGTNHEFGFDYLRDNMKTEISQLVQRPFNFAIIDEVDNILIDEARTPLIISGESVESSYMCEYADHVVRQLVPEDYEKEEKSRNVYFTEAGLKHLEEILHAENVIKENDTLFDEENVLLVHHINQSLKAHTMYNEGIQYIVKDGQVIIVDEFTGRIMDGRRYSDGLHQAIEAKERVEIQKENQTLATITYQKFFELYPKKSGMTGTAMTESEEFLSIYGLLVVPIPSNRKTKRIALDDRIYRTFEEKIAAIVEIVKEARERMQPVLIGTVSVEKSEVFAHALNHAGVPHQVLNAKNHAYEASIIAQAGVPGAVTIATNMAGRGTDIKLGGSLEMLLEGIDDPDEETVARMQRQIDDQAELVRNAGGLFVLGTERHESRRIDNQLVGRSGRQGDPGMSLFVVSLDDTLMKVFGGESLSKWLPRLGHKYGEAIEHPWMTRSMAKAQKKVEAYYFDMRKNVLRYDTLINDQSKIVYKERFEFMTAPDVFDIVQNMKDITIDDYMQQFFSGTSDEWKQQSNLNAFAAACKTAFDITVDINHIKSLSSLEQIENVLQTQIDEKLNSQNEIIGFEDLELISKHVCLNTLDMLWRQHLTQIENLRQGIGLRSYAQKDPLNEFKREAFLMFEDMMHKFRETVVSCIFHHKASVEQNVDQFDLEDMSDSGADEEAW